MEFKDVHFFQGQQCEALTHCIFRNCPIRIVYSTGEPRFWQSSCCSLMVLFICDFYFTYTISLKSKDKLRHSTLLLVLGTVSASILPGITAIKDVILKQKYCSRVVPPQSKLVGILSQSKRKCHAVWDEVSIYHYLQQKEKVISRLKRQDVGGFVVCFWGRKKNPPWSTRFVTTSVRQVVQ